MEALNCPPSQLGSAKAGVTVAANIAAIIAITVRTDMMRLMGYSFFLGNPRWVAPTPDTIPYTPLRVWVISTREAWAFVPVHPPTPRPPQAARAYRELPLPLFTLLPRETVRKAS